MSDNIPAGESPPEATALTEAQHRADYFERLVAAIVSIYGPVAVTGAQYAAADPRELITIPAVINPENATPDTPVIYAMTNQTPQVRGEQHG